MDDIKTIARNISLIENHLPGYQELLLRKQNGSAPVIGITGAPGAGKSTLTDALIEEIIRQNKTVAVLCVDPSSPFNMGALLGDRIRMNRWYENKDVYIRSLASRKSLGGLSPTTMEISDYLKTAGFDYVVIETVGVGQSEIEIAGLADITIVILVPEGGDDIQAMKSGIMEIADIFVINKSDRPGADILFKHLKTRIKPATHKLKKNVAIIKTVASEGTGISELFEAIKENQKDIQSSEKKYRLMAEKAYHMIASKKMSNISKEKLFETIKAAAEKDENFNLYAFILTEF